MTPFFRLFLSLLAVVLWLASAWRFGVGWVTIKDTAILVLLFGLLWSADAGTGPDEG